MYIVFSCVACFFRARKLLFYACIPIFNAFFFMYLVLSDCGPPTTPENGSVEIFPNTECGSIAMYSCVRGFLLEGEMVQTCQRDGQWSNQTPHCPRELNIH